MSPPTRRWWRHGVCYQIWPTSFATTSTTAPPIGTSPTGTSGSIRGIISRLDYIQSLGTDYIWMSPCFASPLKDQGYDISDYEKIHPSYGTVEDVEELITQLHARDMRLILDLVINHTSDQHAWFKESRKAGESEYADFYHWQDARYTRSKSGAVIRRPPNQWSSFFGGAAWTWDETRQQYYLHLFLDSMPDLNWEHHKTRDAIFASSMQFWLEKGVDGFRIDACGLYSKTFSPVDQNERPEAFSPEEIQNAVPVEQAGEEEQQPLVFDVDGYCSGPRMHEFMRELRTQTTSKFGDEILFLCENAPCSYDESLRYLDPIYREQDMYFDFGLHTSPGPWTAGTDGIGTWDKSGMQQIKHVKQPAVESWDEGRVTYPVPGLHYAEGERMPTPPLPLAYLRQGLMKTQSYIDRDRWCALWLENHDVPRSISRFGHQGSDSALRTKSAKLLAILQTTLSGSLFLYQGQEIGMHNIPTAGKDAWALQDLRDVWFTRKIKAAMDERYGSDVDAAQAERNAWGAFQVSGRDNARTPMQWTADRNAGFCDAEQTPWMRVNKKEGDGVSVAEQQGQPGSILEFWRHALKVRREHESTLCYGSTVFVDNENERVLSYIKKESDGKGRVLVVLNFSDTESEMPEFSEVRIDERKVLLSNDEGPRRTTLTPWEGRVYGL